MLYFYIISPTCPVSSNVCEKDSWIWGPVNLIILHMQLYHTVQHELIHAPKFREDANRWMGWSTHIYSIYCTHTCTHSDKISLTATACHCSGLMAAAWYRRGEMDWAGQSDVALSTSVTLVYINARDYCKYGWFVFTWFVKKTNKKSFPSN